MPHRKGTIPSRHLRGEPRQPRRRAIPTAFVARRVYDTIGSAKEKQGKFVHIIAKLDKSKPVEYDAIKNPNYLTFFAVDSLGGKTKVVFHNSKPADLEKSERLVMKGKMGTEHFECSDILLKCPSKYKDDKQQLQNEVKEQTSMK